MVFLLGLFILGFLGDVRVLFFYLDLVKRGLFIVFWEIRSFFLFFISKRFF